MGKEFSDTVIPDRKMNEVKEGAKISKRTFSIIQISTKALCRIKFIFEYQQVGYDSWNEQRESDRRWGQRGRKGRPCSTLLVKTLDFDLTHKRNTKPLTPCC